MKGIQGIQFATFDTGEYSVYRCCSVLNELFRVFPCPQFPHRYKSRELQKEQRRRPAAKKQVSALQEKVRLLDEALLTERAMREASDRLHRDVLQSLQLMDRD